jgi:hypothetical protein
MTTPAEIPGKLANGPLSAGLSLRKTNRSFSIPNREYNGHSPLTLEPTQLLFAGRLGGNQEFIINRHDPAQAALLQKTPDAAPFMSLGQTFDLRGLWDLDLWKAAFVEGIGRFFPILFMQDVGKRKAYCAGCLRV